MDFPDIVHPPKNPLPDLGLYFVENTAPLLDVTFEAGTCQVVGVLMDKPGVAHVVFKTEFFEQNFMGSLLIREKPKRIAQRLANYNNRFGFSGRIDRSEAYVDHIGLKVQPFTIKGKLLLSKKDKISTTEKMSFYWQCPLTFKVVKSAIPLLP